MVLPINSKLKVLASLIITTLVFGCANNNSREADNLRSDDTGWFKSVPQQEAASIANKYQYKMLYIDTSKNIDKKKRNIFVNFANQLGDYGVVLEINDLSLLEKKRLLSKAFRNLNVNYQYYDTPFIILLSKGNQGFFPKKIMSFSNMSHECIKEGLSRIENNIHKELPEHSLISNLEKYKLSGCSFLEKNQEEIKTTLLDLLKSYLGKK